MDVMERSLPFRMVRLQLALLALTFLLGMGINLFVTSSTSNLVAGALIGSHVVLAVLLAVLGAMIFLRVQRSGDRFLILPARVGGASIGLAIICGIAFIFSNSNVFSYLMAAAFLAAFGAYGFLAGKVVQG